MATARISTAVPDPAWGIPASNWTEILNRYTTLLQVPTWRASVKRGGKETAACLSADKAARLRNRMLTVLRRVADGKLLTAKPSSADLTELWHRGGRNNPRSKRCPQDLQKHFQRAFLLNASGYKCTYCHRTAWSVFEEKCGHESPRTLRFEIDHYTTRRRLPDPDRFDPGNLVAACRSCNTIKAEMSVERFLAELASLGGSIQLGRGKAMTV